MALLSLPSLLLLLVLLAVLLPAGCSPLSVSRSSSTTQSYRGRSNQDEHQLLRARESLQLSGATEWNVSRPEGVRRFWVRLPLSYDNSSGVLLPALLAFHGLGDSCESFGPAVGFAELSDASPSSAFIYVVPCGSNGLIGTGWNAGTCCLQPTSVDDVAFARAMVRALVEGGLRVDQQRVWAAGFSNGAMMAEVLGCNAADVFAAVASVGGVVEMLPGNDDGLAACDRAFKNSGGGKAVVSVLKVHGTADEVVPWTGDSWLGFPAIPVDTARWVTRNGCLLSSNHSTFHRGHFSNIVYSSCPAVNASVQLVSNAGGQHEWPQTRDFNTSLAIVQFLFAANNNTHHAAWASSSSTV